MLPLRPPLRRTSPPPTDLADFATWTVETTARDHLDQSATLTLDALADHVASFFRTFGNGAGDLFARTMEELAQKIRFTGAETPADYEARIEILDAEVNEQREAIAYEEGRQHGRHEAGRLAAGYLD